MLRGICFIFFAFLLLFDTQVFAGPIYDKIQKGIEKNLVVFHKYQLLHGDNEYSDLAKKIVVDGITLEQFIAEYMAEYRDIDSTFISKYGQRHNRAKAYFEQTKNNEISCRNIIAEYSSYGAYHEPSDYQVVAGWYLHTFGRYGKEYDCKHSSFDGLKNHVYWINESDRAYRDMLSTPESPNENAINAYVDEQITQFVKTLEPYKKLYFGEQEKIRVEKTKEIEKQIAMIEPKIDKIICEKIIGAQDVANIKFLTKKIRCKKYQQCKLVAKDDGGEDVWIGCACGHGMDSHKVVFKKGMDCSQEKKLLGVE